MRRLPALILIACSACAPIDSAGEKVPPSIETSARIPDDAERVDHVVVIDGDSFAGVSVADDVEFRLAGINAPEGDECLGDAARSALRSLAGESVLVQARDRDQFGRTVIQAWTGDGRWINQELVAQGLALTLSGAGDAVSEEEVDRLIAAQERAHASGLGVWSPSACGAGGPLPAVTLDLTSPNPPGPDDDVLEDEYVIITNRSDSVLDLSGWTLRDESTANRLVFLAGTTLDPGASVRVITGCESGLGIVPWCSDRSIWSNGGDSAYLLDGDGRIVATDRYRP